MVAAASASTSSAMTVCFNSNCKEALERPRKGWRRRTGEYADLCDRCASAYDEGKFCETFHLNASGWRCCESCGKQIHCGCIVSFHMFVLLDAGGIECITCARKSFILTPNPAWPPPSLFLPLQPERIKDLSVKNWSSIAGSGPVPWRQAPSLFNDSTIQSESQSRVPFESEVTGGIDRLRFDEQLCQEKRTKEESFERLMNGGHGLSASEMLGTVNSGASCQNKPSPCVNSYQQKACPTIPDFRFNRGSTSKKDSNDHSEASGISIQQPTNSLSTDKRSGSQNLLDTSDGQLQSGRSRVDVRARSQLLPRYWPRITDQELQQISEDSNSVITPLFEKTLSASDAGRIGRLVLPKKCAEAYFPPISQPEGLPLKVQDLKGKEWVFQFRFWPNNNSRMYVLEGITPCIQSMQLQAGDVVTFSRIEPEGKLVMGCRKVSTVSASSEQGNGTSIPGHGNSANGDATKNSKAAEPDSHLKLKANAKPPSVLPRNQHRAESASTLSESDKARRVGREVFEAKTPVRSKRKSSTLDLKSKRLRIENEDMLELKVTWEQVQGLLRPPPNEVPHVFVIEGCEFEEYEQEAPVIGRPTIPACDHLGKRIQWVQCEVCFKWRKIPRDALLPARWTCSENLWDPERSLCSASEELTRERLEALLPAKGKAASKKIKAPKHDPDPIEALEGLDALANLALQEKAGSLPTSSHATTKHPRHRVGCSCIVCIQPPSGKGPKHKQPCDCVVCKSVKRRFKTLMLKRERKQSEKDADPRHLTEKVHNVSRGNSRNPKEELLSDEDYNDNTDDITCSPSSIKGQIDLNIQPEKEGELLPSFSSGSRVRLMLDTRERNQRQLRQPASNGRVNLVGNQTETDRSGHIDVANSVPVDNSDRTADVESRLTASKEDVASSSPSGT